MKICIYDLKVVKTKMSSRDVYLICKERLTPNTFTEVLTGKKVVAESPDDVESLSKYYSVLAVCNYKTGKALFLDKKDILAKCIEINAYKAAKKQKEEDEALQAKNDVKVPVEDKTKYYSTRHRIELASQELFPKSGSWSGSEFTKSPHSLIQHLRDDNWLATRLQSMGLEDVNFLEILTYVQRTPDFIKLRYEYEQRIVKWQIEWMRNGGEGWLVPKGYGGDFVMFNENSDIAFRKGIVATLTAINLVSDAIEEGIERNADLWRESEMHGAYRNTYHPVFNNLPITEEDKEHYEKWLRLRTYEYYQEHKDSVNKYGKITEAMLMSPEEVEDLKVYLTIKHEEKMADIERAKEANKDTGAGMKLKPVDYYE